MDESIKVFSAIGAQGQTCNVQAVKLSPNNFNIIIQGYKFNCTASTREEAVDAGINLYNREFGKFGTGRDGDGVSIIERVKPDDHDPRDQAEVRHSEIMSTLADIRADHEKLFKFLRGREFLRDLKGRNRP